MRTNRDNIPLELGRENLLGILNTFGADLTDEQSDKLVKAIEILR